MELQAVQVGSSNDETLSIHEDDLMFQKEGADKMNYTAVKTKNDSKTQPTNDLRYSVDDVPPWHLSFLLGFQHYLTMLGGTVMLPFIIAPSMCIEDSDPVRSHLVSTIIFVSGIITLLQTTIGVRLPIIQGGTPSFLVPTFAILSLPEWKCPAIEVMANMTYEDKTELWQLRMREIQGAIIVASLFQVVFGFFGVVGLVLRFITPLTIAPAIAAVGLSLFGPAGKMAGSHWGFSSLTMVLIILFSQYMRNIKCPFPVYQRVDGETKRRCGIAWLDIFVLLPVLLSIAIVWILCFILTASDALEPDSKARTDLKTQVLYEAPWFRVPYPGQWGWPTVSVSAVFGMLAGVLSSAIESIGDYYACARLAGAKPPPIHAMNRGIGIEGIGCILAGLWGTGNGTTSYSENVGAIGVTKVGSRRIIQAAALMMLFFGVLSKFGALFVTIPEPIIGGIFCAMFGMVTATGLSNLHFVDLNSSRNLFVLGFSTFFSLVLSQWMEANPGAIETGFVIFDQIVSVLLSTATFTAGVIGFTLDNTIPGTKEERGLTEWFKHEKEETEIVSSEYDECQLHKSSTYDLPYITPWLKRQQWSSYVPFLPSYRPRKFKQCNSLRSKKNRGKVLVATETPLVGSIQERS